jgi:hypothetical protein
LLRALCTPDAPTYPDYAQAHKLGYSVPSAVWNIDSVLKTKYTPDIALLESKDAWWFFAYDTFDVQENPARYIVFTEDKYINYVQDRDFDRLLPLPVPEGFKEPPIRPAWADPNPPSFRQAPSSRLRGTLHLVPPETIISLDKDVLNTVRFNRQRVQLLYPHRRLPIVDGKPRPDLVVHKLMAWMYVASQEYWGSMVSENPQLFKPAPLQRPASFWIGNFAYKEGLL